LNNNHIVRIFDTHYNEDKTIIKEIIKEDFDYVGISTTELHYNHALKVANELKKILNVNIIMGGSFPTICPEIVLKNKFIDIVCVGEGEYPLNKLLKNEKIDNIKGLWYKLDNKIIQNDASVSFDINSFKITNYSLFNEKSIIQKRKFSDGVKKIMFIWGSRGCRYKCEYCCNSIIRKIQNTSLKHRNIDNIIEEMKFYSNRYNVDEFFFADENFLENKKQINEFCIKYNRSSLDIPFGFLSQPIHINKRNIKVIKLLKETGCSRIHMGIEIGNEKYRKSILKRNVSNNQLIDAFQICKKLGIKTRGFCIIGFYFESLVDIQKTYDLTIKCKPDEISCSIFYPFKGTKLRNYYDKNKLLDNEKVELKNYFEDCIVEHQKLSKLEILSLRQKILTLYPKKANLT
jgi:radical SAM superfamily enzyme YgiQ (UPF0313 family)